MAFEKGRLKTGGRKSGSLNKGTIEIKMVARNLLEDPTYLELLRERIYAGKAPRIEQLLFYYAYGKPTETMSPTESWEPIEFTLNLGDRPLRDPNTPKK